MPTILIVDDDAAVGRLVAEGLAAAGFRVVSAADTTEAQVKLDSAHVDLCLVDLVMPRGHVDGLTFAA